LSGRTLNIRKIYDRYNAVIYSYSFLFIFIIIFSIFFPVFRGHRNVSNILVQIVPLAIIAIGQTVVLIGGGVDLTIGAVISVTTVIAANFMGASGSGVFLGLIFIFVIAVAVGFLNGFICNETNIPPLIATLGVANIIKGLNLLYKREPAGHIPDILSKFMLHKFSIFSTSIFLVIILYIFFVFFLSKTRFGLYTYALGGNEAYARMSGIKIKKVRIGTYVISAVLASIAGIIIGSRTGNGSPLVGDSFLMDSLTAAIVGGTGFAGGSGFVAGAFAGAGIVAIMSNALNISDVSPFYQYIAKGTILLLAMIINSQRKAK
jgi:ribose transport system permease protein